MKVGEFFVQLGVEADTMKVKEFVGSLGDISLTAAAAILSLAGISYELKNLISDTFDTAIGFKKFQDQTGLSAMELQKWQLVAEQAGVSADTVASSISGLLQFLGHIAVGLGGERSGFALLGISASQDPFAILEELRKASKRYTGEQRQFFTQAVESMGISRDFLSVLSLTDDQFNKMAGSIKGMDLTQLQKFLEMRKELVLMGQQFKQVGYEIVEALEPVFAIVKKIAEGWEYIFKGFNLVKSDLKDFFKGKDSLTGDLINYLDKHFGTGAGYKPGGPFPWELTPAAAGASGQNINMTNNFTITGGDADLIGKSVVRELDKLPNQTKQANVNTPTGLKR